jgi:hypothetical protein
MPLREKLKPILEQLVDEVFVEFRIYFGLWYGYSALLIDGPDDFCRAGVPFPRTNDDFIEVHAQMKPVHAQRAGLCLAQQRQLVIILR